MTTVAQTLASAFDAYGVKRVFGVPGGGSSLDVIDAAAEHGIEFVLSRTESAAVMMAAVTAELQGTIGVALTTKGPGTANAANGIAYACLDRAPVLVIADGFTPAEEQYVTHQVFDQQALLSPITKGHSRLESGDVGKEIAALVELALRAPSGPVFIELTSARASDDVQGVFAHAPATLEPNLDTAALAKAEALFRGAQRPVIIVGLEAREADSASAVRTFSEKLGCPVLTTYKAKGVVSDAHEFTVGQFTSGSAEAETVDQADLIALIGLDPVELLRQPWRYSAPVIDIGRCRHPVHYVTPEVGIYGAIAPSVASLARQCQRSGWETDEIASLRAGMLARLRYPECGGVSPQAVVELAASATAQLLPRPRITVDAGAHMFSVMAFWPCREPNEVFISNGLATMAFALPAGIAASLQDRQRKTLAFTGDGGLLMCLGELSVAAEQDANLLVIVFNDQSLSLIDIKQQKRGLASRGVRWKQPDFATTMNGLGGRGYRAESVAEYQNALIDALSVDGPALIDVAVDPSGYAEQMKALRG